MVATRSKTRTSTGGEETQPKIDDALDQAQTGRKRRTSKGGAEKVDNPVKKGEPKTKKRKTGEAPEKDDDQHQEVQEVQKNEPEVEEPGPADAVEEPKASETNGEEESGVAGEEEKVDEKDQGKSQVIDSSRDNVNVPVEEADTKPAEHEGKAENDNQDDTENAIAEPQEVQTAEKEVVQHDNVIEYGRIHFLYKPKVEVLHPGSVDDVQRLYIILQPHNQDQPSGKPVLSRMLHVGRKVLPAAGKGRRQPFWAFVSAVAEDVGELHDALKETKNDTKTRGVRTTGASRLFASGAYCIVSQPANSSGSNPDRRTSYLCYTTTLPHEAAGEVPKAFNVEAEGSFTISVKNPSYGDPPQAGLKAKADYPEELQSQMGTLRWHAVDPPNYLDYPHAELLFIASHDDDIAHDAGEEIAHELEKIADEGDVADVPEDEKHRIEESVLKRIYGMLKARGTEKTIEGGEESLINGTWV